MPELPRELPHLYLRNTGLPERYTSKNLSRGKKLPERNRLAHADRLGGEIAQALADAERSRAQREPELLSGPPGFRLDFEIPAGAEIAAELLENRQKGIELVAFRQDNSTEPAQATVFVPDSAANHFRKKIEEYRTRNTQPRRPKDPDTEPIPGRPKNESLIARLNSVRLGGVRSTFTDDLALLPAADEIVWWEVWIRQDHSDGFDTIARRLALPVEERRLVFPDREVRLVYANLQMLERLYWNSSSIAEIRRAKDTPALFTSWSNNEQAVWAADLAGRVVAPDGDDIAICVLDTGATQAHPLLALGLNPNDVHKCDPLWSDGDRNGHGTNMAGAALYGDLMSWLETNVPVRLTHCLESVKILPDHGENEPKLYGAITNEAVARAEVAAPYRRRAVSLAVTSAIGTMRGRPSSWSAAIDQLSYGDGTTGRLVLVSAGNIREGITRANYPARNELASIENPAQAWNAITVGAITEKSNLADPAFAGWQPLAPVGDLCPTSRTSLVWERQWPIKPDIVMEGGNWATSGDQCDCPDDLGLLTTHHDPSIRHFAIFRDTSAATALASHLAGRILAHLPRRWPETIRALLIHSAEWTPAMRRHFDAAGSIQTKRSLLRKYGYGVPNYERAVLSSANDLTLIAEDEVEPFWKDGGRIKTRNMNLHDFPWPRTQLEELGAAEVELRVTLSYFIEPNPGERGWLRRHRYASHSLRFAVKRPLESVNEFRRRINAVAAAEEEGHAAAAPNGTDNWLLGRGIRDTGSIHSDHWRGTAADLAQRSSIGVFPIGGWWKENPHHDRYERRVRYALIVSIRAISASVDIYTPVAAQITLPTEITT